MTGKIERNIWILNPTILNPTDNCVDDIVHNVVYENVKLFIGFEHGCQTTFDGIAFYIRRNKNSIYAKLAIISFHFVWHA